jgi:hypothetical protein
MTEQKLTPEEVTNLKTLQSEQQNIISTFGELEYQIQLLEIEKEKIVEELEQFKQQEKQLASILSTKYGDGIINLEKEVFQTQN